ncbi:phospho-sugar mutase [Clostridium oceanicum]|uniref:Phospho-sugar mutase n=1 Tax=Clostridium oceanicum TaxID=1543 RepID=A0ABP3V4J6_9CLOT
MNYKERYSSWINSPYINNKNKEKLKKLKEEEIKDRFYKEIEFGTGGLRGLIGLGSNRINVFMVAKVTQGLSDFLNNRYKNKISVAIAYDSRNMSLDFARKAAEVFCGNNIKTYIFKNIMPTPMLSYAVRNLNCKAGIVITASHNSKEYNGYKVYNKYGGQITDRDAKDIYGYIKSVKDFENINYGDLGEAKKIGLYNLISDTVENSYYSHVKDICIRKNLIKKNSESLKIIYTPLHGTGNIPVRRVLKDLGYENVFVVKQQERPDGEFSTVKYPNPEYKEVFDIAVDMAKNINPDIIIGTDPDCDRMGVMVKNKKNKYIPLTGNEVGALLTNYILEALKEINKLPKESVIIKTIVTTDMIKFIARKFNIEVIEVLTGFKYIGEKIEEINKDKKFIFGLEESYGYLFDTFVRDKDGVIAAVLVSEMTLYYKSKGKSLYEVLMELYKEYGCFTDRLVSIDLLGEKGEKIIEESMNKLRYKSINYINDTKIVRKIDYKYGTDKCLNKDKIKKIQLPKSNVLKYYLEDDSSFVIRPSGTEPKIKMYLSCKGKEIKQNNAKLDSLQDEIINIIN